MNMLGHFITVAMRNLIRHKAFSAINIAGLTLGMTCCLFIFLWIQDEQMLDNFHANGKNLYTIYHTRYSNGEATGGYAIPFIFTSPSFDRNRVLAEEIKQSFQDVKYATSYATGYDLPWGHPETFQVGEKLHKMEGSRAGADFFRMFSYPLLAGDPETALKDISSLAISRNMADLFFGNATQAIGKSIRYENQLDFIVTAVFENVPAESSLKFDFLINWEICKTGKIENADNKWQTFIQFHENSTPATTELALRHFLDNRIDKNAGYKVELGLQPFGDQYLVSNFENGKPRGGRIEYIKIFSGIALFILIIACINFMNLATARSIKRAKEVGIRKANGSSRTYLIAQFLGESLLVSFFSMLLLLALAYFLLPIFNAFTSKQISFPLASPFLWLALACMVLVTGLVAGSYPALFLSSLKPVHVLKGVLRFSNKAMLFKKGLVVFQFILSIVLLINTIVVSRQTNFLQHSHLGYDRENLIYIRIEGELNPNYKLFKERASAMPGIAMVDRSSEAPHAMGFTVTGAINWEGKEKDLSVGFKPTSVGYDFLNIMNLKTVEGRGFRREFSTDSSSFMINEEAVRQTGLKDPIGKWISAWDKKGTIIGILKDYHTNSLHEPISPLIIDVKEDLYFGVIIARTEPGKTKQAIASLEKVYKEINPGYPFAYQFLDTEYEKLYRNEQMITKLSNAFAALAILISCLGLLGLVMFAAEQRTKEIGIRKALGASSTSILSLLSKDFLALVLTSFFIAAPTAGYFMSQWLSRFAYKIDLSWWIFALAGALSLLIALLTIAVQAIQSSINNPVKSLRSE